MVLRYDFAARLDGIQRTPQGGIRATANLTRTGVFDYQGQKELRHPDDVFSADALASMKGAPITIEHKAHITTENFREHVVGHVGDDPRPNGNFVSATIYVQDAEACAMIERGELVEVSMGYQVTMVPQSGEYEGETYSARQTGIRYNHAALGPRDWGRAGNDVRIVLDTKDDGGESVLERATRDLRERNSNAWTRTTGLRRPAVGRSDGARVEEEESHEDAALPPIDRARAAMIRRNATAWQRRSPYALTR